MPQKPTKLDENDTTRLSRHLYILCHFAATYTNALCVFQLCAEEGCGKQCGG